MGAEARQSCHTVDAKAAVLIDSSKLPQSLADHYCAMHRRRTKRWEAHIWDDKKQVYLGGFDVEEHAGIPAINLSCCRFTAHAMLCSAQYSLQILATASVLRSLLAFDKLA